MAAVAVLGGTGRIGRHVVAEALARGAEVRVLVRDPSRLPVRDDRLEVLRGDARDAAAVRRVLEGATAVISSLGPRGNTPREGRTSDAYLGAAPFVSGPSRSGRAGTQRSATTGR